MPGPWLEAEREGQRLVPFPLRRLAGGQPFGQVPDNRAQFFQFGAQLAVAQLAPQPQDFPA